MVIPNLLTWPDSVVFLDVKRENWEASAGFRAAHGQEVNLFDPFDAEGRTARFNPLGHIDRTDPIALLDELQKLAVMLFPRRPTPIRSGRNRRARGSSAWAPMWRKRQSCRSASA